MKKCSYELLIANRKYKDTIFRWIFSQTENLLSRKRQILRLG